MRFENLLLSEKSIYLGLRRGCFLIFLSCCFWKKRHLRMPVGQGGQVDCQSPQSQKSGSLFILNYSKFYLNPTRYFFLFYFSTLILTIF